MHRFGAWIVAKAASFRFRFTDKPAAGIVVLALMLGAGLSTAGAGENDWPGSTEEKPAPGGGHVPDNWFTRWVKSRVRTDPGKPEPRKPETKPDKEPVAKPASPARPAGGIDDLTTRRQREQEILLRRLSTCDRLEEIAFHTNDDELQHKVEQLKERAQSAYSQRIANLAKSGSHFESDENCLENHLGAGAPVHDRSQAGGPPFNVREKDRNAHAAAKEERP